MERKFDYLLFFVIVALMILGAVMVYSSSSVVNLKMTSMGKSYEIANHFFIKQFIFVFVAIVVMTVGINMNLVIIRKIAKALWPVSVLLMVALLFWGKTVNGASRWFQLGSFGFNPAELAKIVMIVYLADLFTRKNEDIRDFKKGVVPSLVIIYSIVIGVLIQKDLSTALLIIILGWSMLYLANARWKHLMGIAGLNIAIGLFMVLLFPYRIKRILAFFDPSHADPGSLYQAKQSLIALGNGGITGVGLGNSYQKYFFLPEAHTDYIMSIIGEEWGFLGIVVIVLLFLVVLWRGIKIARRTSDPFKQLLAWGISLNFIYYALLHMMIVAHMIPSTGIGLPFISYGGSALIANAILASMLINISAENYQNESPFRAPVTWQEG